jgi:hypothetical protein
MPEGSIDAQKLVAFVTKDRKDPWKSILTEAVEVCKNYTEGKILPLLYSINFCSVI